VADRRGRTGDFPWTEVLTVGAILFVLAGVVGAGLDSIFTSGGSGTTETVTAAGGGGTTTVSYPKESALVAEGAHDFVRFACSQCHGFDGKGGVSPYVPSLSTLAPSLTPAELTNIINTGRGISSNPTKPFMPVWHNIISSAQIAALVAYLHAGLPPVKDAEPLDVPTDQGAAVAGSIDYINFGCINCHGPNGLGGVPNPLSQDTVIPPLGTPDFFKQFNTARKIQAVIVSGSVIGKHPIVDMPHWGGILTQTEITDLIAYIHTLQRPNNGTTTYKP
jgi:mono/diheme cytochrome c family protein